MNEKVKKVLGERSHVWLVTGAAGFIGGHICEFLLNQNQKVIGLDNLNSGSSGLIGDFDKKFKSTALWSFHEIDICDKRLNSISEGADFILHQAALASVPRSIEKPDLYHEVNVSGSLNVFAAARANKTKKVVYASTSAVYGDDTTLPKVEEKMGKPLSPYGATKLMVETYAKLYSDLYFLPSVGLRYFNIFGPRQNPQGAYAAVIAQWAQNFLTGVDCTIYGDGKSSRDFCYIDAVVEANILAAFSDEKCDGRVFNIGSGEQTSLNQLFSLMRESVLKVDPGLKIRDPIYKDSRAGDITHSVADISRAKKELNFSNETSLQVGLEKFFISLLR